MSKHKHKSDSADGAKTKAIHLSDAEYLKELRRLQIELVKLEESIKHEGLKVVAIFEGRDAAGKGGVIKRIAECGPCLPQFLEVFGITHSGSLSSWRRPRNPTYVCAFSPGLPCRCRLHQLARSLPSDDHERHVIGLSRAAHEGPKILQTCGCDVLGSHARAARQDGRQPLLPVLLIGLTPRFGDAVGVENQGVAQIS